MKIEIDGIINDIVKDLASVVIGKSVEVSSSQYKKALVTFELCFRKYLSRSYERFSKIKTLLYRDRPVDLKSHYVPTDYRLEDENINGIDIFYNFERNKNNIIEGTAGSGKSVLLRRVFIDLIENKKGYVPILIELRLLITPEENYSIYNFIHKTLSELDEGFTSEQLHFALKEGKIALFLDGFDEIDFDHKETYEREILDISNKYSSSIIVVSSRPDDCFSSWGEFYIYHALPLNKEQSIDLISRIEYDMTVKKRFIAELKEGLYEKHIDFLSNPLLLTMMLLTYEQLAEIPEKIHIFYEQAFDTLYHKHDALKSLYKRKSYSGLPIDDFKKIFSTFCIITFAERKISFTYKELIDYLGKAINIEGFEVKPTNIFKDLVKSVCILQKDGNIYTFTHRSFQEYFTAYFISKSQSIDTRRILDNMLKTLFRDNVITMLFDLNKEKVETEWVIPSLKEIIEVSEPLINRKDLIGFLSVFYDAFSFHDSGVALRFSETLTNGYFASWLHRLYPDISITLFPKDVDEGGEAREATAKKELQLFKKYTSLKDPNADILFSDMPTKLDWLSETWIPNYCEKKYEFMKIIYRMLTNKYADKKHTLSAILFEEYLK